MFKQKRRKKHKGDSLKLEFASFSASRAPASKENMPRSPKYETNTTIIRKNFPFQAHGVGMEVGAGLLTSFFLFYLFFPPVSRHCKNNHHVGGPNIDYDFLDTGLKHNSRRSDLPLSFWPR